MARYTGRQHDVLAQNRYILHWIWDKKSKGPVNMKPRNCKLNKTNTIVLSREPYYMWLDNIFVSNSLLHYSAKKAKVQLELLE